MPNEPSLKQVYKVFDKLERWQKKEAAQTAADTALAFVRKRFQRKNWRDQSPEPWAPLKAAPGRSPLRRRGRLFRSIRKGEVRPTRAVIVTDVPYAQAHNEGAHIQKNVRVRKHTRRGRGRNHEVQAHTRRMNTRIPARPFMHASATLTRAIGLAANKQINDILKTIK